MMMMMDKRPDQAFNTHSVATDTTLPRAMWLTGDNDDEVHGIQEFFVGGAGKGDVHISDINQFRMTKDALHYVLRP